MLCSNVRLDVDAEERSVTFVRSLTCLTGFYLFISAFSPFRPDFFNNKNQPLRPFVVLK